MGFCPESQGVNLKCGKILNHETVNKDSGVCTQQEEYVCMICKAPFTE